MSGGGGSQPAPDYTILNNLIVLIDSRGLVINTSNEYGTVDGSGNVLEVKSISPTPTPHLFEDNGTAPTLTADGILFGASGRLRAADSLTWANPLHYNANINNLSWTIHRIGKIGSSENPNGNIGLFGNNGTSSASKGISAYYLDTLASSHNNKLVCNISRGTAYIANLLHGDCIIPNRDFLLSIRYIHSNSQNSRYEIYINGRLMLNLSVDNPNSSPVTTPTYQFEIGGCGNATLSGVQTLRHFSIQTGIDSQEVFEDHMNRLMGANGYNLTRTQDGIPTDYVFNPINILSEGRYPFSSKIIQSTSNPNVLVNVFADWELGHTWRDGNTIAMQKSTDRGLTWGSKQTIYNPASLGVVDMGGGIDASGRMYFFTDVHDGSGTTIGSNHSLILGYSDDDGETWNTTDLSSLIPATDSLRALGQLREANGVIMFPFYSFDAEGDVNPNTRHVARKVGAGAWTRVDVETTTTTFRNESALIHLTSNNWLMVTRDEATLEWTQYFSDDNGATWSNQGDLTFGETLTGAAPVSLNSFIMGGQKVIACYFSDRPNRRSWVCYGLASSIVSSGISGWNLSTKTLLRIPNGSNLYHYGGVVHPYDDFRAIGAYAFDTLGWGDSSTTQMHRFTLPTWHYNTVKAALGL